MEKELLHPLLSFWCNFLTFIFRVSCALEPCTRPFAWGWAWYLGCTSIMIIISCQLFMKIPAQGAAPPCPARRELCGWAWQLGSGNSLPIQDLAVPSGCSQSAWGCGAVGHHSSCRNTRTRRSLWAQGVLGRMPADPTSAQSEHRNSGSSKKGF